MLFDLFGGRQRRRVVVRCAASLCDRGGAERREAAGRRRFRVHGEDRQLVRRCALRLSEKPGYDAQ